MMTRLIATRSRSRLTAEGVLRVHGQRGFTLIELMVTIVVMAILLAIVIPSFTDITLGSKLRAQANDLAAGALLARSEAVKRNVAMRLCASSDGATCSGSWVDGWIVITGSTGGGTVITKHAAASSGFHINSGVTSIVFQSSGVGSTSTTLTVCRASPSVGSQERVVSISATGRTRVTKTTAGSCS